MPNNTRGFLFLLIVMTVLVVTNIAHPSAVKVANAARGFAYIPENNDRQEFNSMSKKWNVVDGGGNQQTGMIKTEPPVSSHTTSSTTTNTLDSKIQTLPNANILRQLVRYTALKNVLSNPERQYTIFAPTDRAFEFLPEGALQYLEAKPRELKYVVQSHIIPQSLTSADLQDGMQISGLDGTMHVIHRKKMSTQQEEGYEGSGGIDEWTIDGIRILDVDFTATNGVVHKIDGVLGSTKVILPAATSKLQEAKNICQNRGMTGFQLANCVRLVTDGLDSDIVPTRPDLQDLPYQPLEN